MNQLFMQNVMSRANQLAQQFQNPQQLISRMIPGIPDGIRNDPNQILNWLQQTGKVSDQQIMMARQMMGQR